MHGGSSQRCTHCTGIRTRRLVRTTRRTGPRLWGRGAGRLRAPAPRPPPHRTSALLRGRRRRTRGPAGSSSNRRMRRRSSNNMRTLRRADRPRSSRVCRCSCSMDPRYTSRPPRRRPPTASTSRRKPSSLQPRSSQRRHLLRTACITAWSTCATDLTKPTEEPNSAVLPGAGQVSSRAAPVHMRAETSSSRSKRRLSLLRCLFCVQRGALCRVAGAMGRAGGRVPRAEHRRAVRAPGGCAEAAAHVGRRRPPAVAAG